MSYHNFVNILDAIQERKKMEYVDYLHVLNLTNYHYQLAEYGKDNFCGTFEKKVIEPVKTKNPFHNKLLKNKIFQDFKPKTNIVKKKSKHIDVNIESITDLIKIIDDNEYDEETEYNIDLLALRNIKNELIQLDNMIGLKDFKVSILDQLLYFIQNLHVGVEADFMHTVICGPPGTGKTEIAIILGKMYSNIGILKKKIFKKVNRSDLVAGYLGQTAIKTTTVIEECLGGCLFIDEAYSLANNYEGDSYTRECIDTLCECLSKHKGELMVIIAGYKDELKNTFFKANKGMESRFIWRFYLECYDHNELQKIFEKKVQENEWTIDIESSVLSSWFKTNYKDFPYYGRDVEQLFSYVKMSHGRRIYGKKEEKKKKLILVDIENGFKKFKNHRTLEEPINERLFGLYV